MELSEEAARLLELVKDGSLPNRINELSVLDNLVANITRLRPEVDAAASEAEDPAG